MLSGTILNWLMGLLVRAICATHSIYDQNSQEEVKSDNLQYNTLGPWVVRLIDQASDGPHVWSKYYFDRLKIKQWVAGLYLLEFIKNKNKIERFLQRILQEIMKKNNNTWNIRRLVDESLVPVTQRPSVLY